jgi:hypothetical protein
MKSALSGFIGAAVFCAVCGCNPHQPPVAKVPGGENGPSEVAASHDQPIKGHDGRLQGGSVQAVAGLVHVDILNADATPVYSADRKIREVDIVATESQTIRMIDILIDGILYKAAKRQIDTPWTITLRDRKHHGITVSTQNPTATGQNITIKTEDDDYFDASSDPQHSEVTIYSLNDQKCQGDVSCREFDSIEVEAANSHKATYPCGNHNEGTTCAIEIGMLHGIKR